LRLKIEPSKLKDMLTTGMIGGKLSNIGAIIKPTMLSFQDMSEGALGVYALYGKGFFPKGGYENQTEEVVTLTKPLLDALSKGFKNDEQIELYTEDNKLFAVGARNRFEDVIPEAIPSVFPIKMKPSQYGLIPEKADLGKSIVAKFSVDELRLISADKYLFVSDGKKLDVRIEFTDTSAYTKTLKPLTTVNMPIVTSPFSGEFYDAVLKTLTGEVWFIMDENAITITKKEKTFSITMLLAGTEL